MEDRIGKDWPIEEIFVELALRFDGFLFSGLANPNESNLPAEMLTKGGFTAIKAKNREDLKEMQENLARSTPTKES